MNNFYPGDSKSEEIHTRAPPVSNRPKHYYLQDLSGKNSHGCRYTIEVFFIRAKRVSNSHEVVPQYRATKKTPCVCACVYP